MKRISLLLNISFTPIFHQSVCVVTSVTLGSNVVFKQQSSNVCETNQLISGVVCITIHPMVYLTYTHIRCRITGVHLLGSPMTAGKSQISIPGRKHLKLVLHLVTLVWCEIICKACSSIISHYKVDVKKICHTVFCIFFTFSSLKYSNFQGNTKSVQFNEKAIFKSCHPKQGGNTTKMQGGTES